MPAASPFRILVAVVVVGTLAVPAAVSAQQPGGQTPFERGWQNGTPATITGELTAIFADDFERGRSELMHFVRDERSGRTFRVRYQADPPRLQNGAIVTLLGRMSQSELYVLAAQTDGMTPLQTGQTLAAPLTTVTGDQRTLVTLVNFSDVPLSCSYTDVENAMFTDPTGLSVDALYRSTSFGRISFSGSVAGPFTINAKSTDTCDIGSWAGAADTLFHAAGGDESGYARRVYVMPPNSCPAAGYGGLGGNPSYSWVFRCDLKGVFAHELGHNIGMDHAATPSSEYADTTDPMSFGTLALRGVNAPHRHQLGWFEPATTSVLTSSGTYQLAPLAMPPEQASAPQIVVIPKPDTGEYYYLSYRHPVGFDSYVDGSYMDRLSVHRYGSTGVLKTFLVAALADGQSFTDPANGLTVTMVSHGATGATASVDIVPVCTMRPPVISASPASQSGVAGTALTYTLSITSNDSAGCSASTFTLTPTTPSGWTAALSAPALTLAAGASTGAVLTVTSPLNAASGAYATTIATGGLEAVHVATATTTYSVTPQCVRSAPSLTGTPISQSAGAGTSLGYSVTVRNVDSSACAADTFNIETALPIGWSANPPATAVTLSPGAIQTLFIGVSSPVNASPGNYALNVRATPADGATSAGTMAATYVVEPRDTQPPTVPTGLTASVSQKLKRVTLSWRPATDNDIVVAYRIFRNGVLAGTSTTSGWTDSAWTNGATYSYFVVAVDGSANASPPSATVTVILGGSSGSGGNGGGKNR